MNLNESLKVMVDVFRCAKAVAEGATLEQRGATYLVDRHHINKLRAAIRAAEGLSSALATASKGSG